MGSAEFSKRSKSKIDIKILASEAYGGCHPYCPAPWLRHGIIYQLYFASNAAEHLFTVKQK